jgi:UDP-N-acetylmuramoyl-L-alanyl-D-glutamate--2,6-diaminopimelate ligase
MAILQDILYKVRIRSVHGDTRVNVNALQLDSRKVSAGDAFIALKGVASDGHDYISKVVEQGAAAVICESMPADIKEGVTYVEVENSHVAAGFLAHNFYGQPSEKLKLVGVTGTNGKTTIATILFKLFSGLGHKCGLLSTVDNHIGDQVVPATHTTPDAVSLNALLKQMVDAGCTHAFMETSSHAIHQHRIAGLRQAASSAISHMITSTITKHSMNISA